MNKKSNLNDQFDNDDLNHFTHYDYLLQLIDNGQYSAFKYHLREISTKSLLRFLRFLEIMPTEQTYKETVEEEILERMKE